MAANTLFEIRTASGGNRAFFSPLSPLAVPLLILPLGHVDVGDSGLGMQGNVIVFPAWSRRVEPMIRARP
jgi:hypothetical protein